MDPIMEGHEPPRTRLLVSCPDRQGIIAEVSRFLNEHDANIVENNQYSTEAGDTRSDAGVPGGSVFLQRTVFEWGGGRDAAEALGPAFAAEVAEPFGMEWRFEDARRPKRTAIFVSRYDHCLLDLLWRARRGELPIEVGMVVSNHADLADDVASFGIPFEHVPVTKETKPEAEAQQLGLLGGTYDLVVLARYMQILSGDFLEQAGIPVINIHHSFLPAFAGAGPYRKARERGVKLIGATAHYVTEDLDEGPIIEQDVVRVSHRDDAVELERRGADVERTTLARAVAWHCEDRVVATGATTVVL
jgi:formyltetrahydrofolate deformylase